MMNFDQVMNLLAALLALLAAFCWYRAATATVRYVDKPDEHGCYPAAILDDDGNDFGASAKLQQEWNRRGAKAAALAALVQGVVLLMPLIILWLKRVFGTV
ncbi:MAG: hypothetical protein LCH89_19535 [Proteobacteria bacterium]|nr:hypothetical protein [Pseudomonadota bacterium]